MTGLADLSSWGKIRFEGADVKPFLHGLLTNDVLSLRAGQGFACCVLTPKGKLLADFLLWDRGEDLLALAVPPAAENLRKAIGAKIVLSQSRMQDASAALGLFYLAGPRTSEVVQRALGASLPAPWRAQAVDWSGVPVWIASYDRVVPGGVLLICLAEKSASLRDRLLEQGRDLGLVAIDERAWDAARIEAGVPLYGRDMDQDTIPLEARLEGAISFTKGCYMGQETVARIKNLGHVNRVLVGLKVAASQASPEPALAGAGLFKDDKEVGRVSSFAWSGRLGAFLALAMIRVSESASGTRLRLQAGEASFDAEVVALPLP